MERIERATELDHDDISRIIHEIFVWTKEDPDRIDRMIWREDLASCN